jgi:phenylpropionate dioxygenase-like ring-hydroxylating dioxygenase large terminal subunit/putative sterol carrier protein
MPSRFPFPSHPRGWFVIGFSSDVAAGEVKTVRYFGQDIVLFRSETGVLSAVDKTCPHVGAHLGGGRVQGECLRCPFHDWAFDAAGRCVDIPYSTKIPPRAAVRTWPLREQNGVILVYHCPLGAPPRWEPPVLPEEQEGWMPGRTIRWEIRSHPQEIGENTVDCTHLMPVHHAHSAEVREVEQQDHFMRVLLRIVATGTVIDMPDEVNEVDLAVTLHGLGILVATTHVLTAGLYTRQRIYPTPVDEERVAIFAVNSVRAMPDPEYSREIDEIFYHAFITDFPRDFPIWENKAYLDKPLLAAGDGPIGRYRKWARQFYEAPSARIETPAAAPQVDDTLAGRVAGGLRRLSVLVAGLGNKPAPAPPAADDEPAPGNGARPARSAAPASPAGPAFRSVDAYFETLERRFDPGAAGDLEAVFQWVLTGERGRAHFVEIKGGQARASEGKHPSPTVAIEMTSDDYLSLINGELSGPLAFSTGRGRLRGPVRVAMKMQRLFPLERRV